MALDRKDVPAKYKWDLTVIYKTEDDFNADLKLAEEMAKGLKDGAKICVMMGLTALSRELIPVEMVGVQSFIISGLTVCALGIRLNILSIEKGQISRTATKPHRSTLTHLGARFSASRRSKTASTSQLADRLIFRILRKTSLIISLRF